MPRASLVRPRASPGEGRRWRRPRLVATSEGGPVSSVVPAPLRRQIGRTGLGVFPYGIDGSVFGWTAGFDAAIEVLDEFHAAGGTLISTADHYAGGRSE